MRPPSISRSALGGCNGNAKKIHRKNPGKAQEGREGVHTQKDYHHQNTQDNQQKRKKECAASRSIT